MADLTIYFQTERNRLINAQGAPLAPARGPSVYFKSLVTTELNIVDKNLNAVTLPSGAGVNWALDIDIGYNVNTAPLLHLDSDAFTASEFASGKLVFTLDASTQELFEALVGRSTIDATLMVRAWQLQEVDGIEKDVTLFACSFPFILDNILNPDGLVHSSIAFTQELVDFLSDKFLMAESDPAFTQWLATNPLASFLTSESDPAFTSWLATNPLSGFLTSESDPAFTSWLATNPLSGFLTSESDPAFTSWLATNPLSGFLTSESDPAFTQWLATNPLASFLTSESDPAFTSWIATNPLSGFVTDAPSDSKQYARRNQQWSEVIVPDTSGFLAKSAGSIHLYTDFISNSLTDWGGEWKTGTAINVGSVRAASAFPSSAFDPSGGYASNALFADCIGVVAICSRTSSGTANSGARILLGSASERPDFYYNNECVLEIAFMQAKITTGDGIASLGQNSAICIGFQNANTTGPAFASDTLALEIDSSGVRFRRKYGPWNFATDLTGLGLQINTWYLLRLSTHNVSYRGYTAQIIDRSGAVLWTQTDVYEPAAYPVPQIMGVYTSPNVVAVTGIPIVFVDYARFYTINRVTRFGQW